MRALAFLKGIYNVARASKGKFKNVNLQWVKTLGSKQKSRACEFFLDHTSSWIHIYGIMDSDKCHNDNNKRWQSMLKPI